MKQYRDFYQRKLPHYQPKQGTLFLTYRLFGSIPKSVIDKLNYKSQLLTNQNGKRNHADAKSLDSKYFHLFDSVLDKAPNEPYWLSNSSVGQIVYDSLKYQDGKQYDLWSFTIMPNHVHSLLTLKANSLNLEEILRHHKRYTARQGNKILQRSGHFWEAETYDHVVRDEIEFANILSYILTNPVKAGFVKKWDDWKWNYINPVLVEGYLPQIGNSYYI